jgi:hypothetical protein
MRLHVDSGTSTWSTDIPAALQQLAARTGTFHPERARWMIPDLIACHAAGYGPSGFAARVRREGQVLSAEEKRNLGINPRFKVTDRLVETLTERGLADINATLSAIFMAPLIVILRESNIKEAAELGTQVRFIAPARESACAAALALSYTSFDPDKAPPIPLEGCDCISCGCMVYAQQPPFEMPPPNAAPAPAAPPPPPPQAIQPQSEDDAGRETLLIVLAGAVFFGVIALLFFSTR